MFYPFGLLLLDDKKGKKVQGIVYKHGRDVEQINMEILQRWIGGEGKQPVTWGTLVEVLRDVELTALADDIAAVKYA